MSLVAHRLVSTPTPFFSPIDVGSHNPPPSGPSVLLAFVPFFKRCGTPQSTHLQSLASLVAHRLVSTSFEAYPPRWHIARCLTLISFVTTQPPADIVLIGLFLLGFPSRFLKRVWQEDVFIPLQRMLRPQPIWDLTIIQLIIK